MQLDGSVFKPYQLAGRATGGQSRLAAPFATDPSAAAAPTSGGSRRPTLAEQLRGAPYASAPQQLLNAPNGESRAQLVPRAPTGPQTQSFKRPPSGRLTPAMSTIGNGGLRRANPTPPNADAPTPTPPGVTYRRQQSEERTARPESRGSASGVGRGRGGARPDSASGYPPASTRAASLSRTSAQLPSASLVTSAFQPALEPNPKANANANARASRGSSGRSRAGVAEPPLQLRGAPPQSYQDLFGAPLDSRPAASLASANKNAGRERCVHCSFVKSCAQLFTQVARL